MLDVQKMTELNYWVGPAVILDNLSSILVAHYTSVMSPYLCTLSTPQVCVFLDQL